MASFIGRSGYHILFAGDEDDRAVIVDSRVSVVLASGALGDLGKTRKWGAGEFTAYDEQAAETALESLNRPAPESTGRMYTIPRGVRLTAERALKDADRTKRGDTPVSRHVATLLASGGQIDFNGLVNVSQYFERHAADDRRKKADGSLSESDIAWRLRGGDAGQKWASAIVEREPITADAYSDSPADLNDLLTQNGEVGPEFIVKISLVDGQILRLYRVDIDGRTYVWNEGAWDDMGHVDWDIWNYDQALDTTPTNDDDSTHLIIDPESALQIAGLMEDGPTAIYVEDLNPDEASMVKDAAPALDWEMLDSTVTAAGGTPGDGVYTPEERSQNATTQLRDAKGQFATVGNRVMVGGNPTATGKITRVDPASGTVEVSLESGGSTIVPAKSVEGVGQFTATIPGKPVAIPRVDLSGILAEPRTPINRTQGQIPGTLPAMTSADLHQIINNFPAWVKAQRAAFQPIGSPGSVAVQNKNSLDTEAEGRKLLAETGKSITTDAYANPLLNQWLNKKNSGGYTPNKLWYDPIIAAASAPLDPSQELTPDNSDVTPMYLAIVSPDDPRAVFALISIVPAGPTSNAPMCYKRQDGVWVRDDQDMYDLKSATPPPVVPLDPTTLQDVLVQVDQHQSKEAPDTDNGLGADGQPLPGQTAPDPTDATTQPQPTATATAAPTPAQQSAAPSSQSMGMAPVAPAATTASAADFELMVLWGPRKDIMAAAALTAAGGLDKNRGGAEKLRRYWTKGPGAAKIMWNTPGDWTRCVRNLGKYLGPRAKGYCFTGDTEYITADGVKTFAATVGTTQLVLTQAVSLDGRGKPVRQDGKWVEAPVQHYGVQPVLSVTLRRGKITKVVRATREHEWFVSLDAKSAARNKVQKITTEQLVPGMATASLLPKKNTDRSTLSPFGVAAGAVFGDGSTDSRGSYIDLWGAKDSALIPYFNGSKMYPTRIQKSDLRGVRITGLPRSWKSLPSLDEGHQFLYGWLAGYIAADGSVTPGGSVSLSSASLANLEFARTVANRLGIGTYGIQSTERVGLGTEATSLYKMGFISDTVPAELLVIEEHQKRFLSRGGKTKNPSPVRWVVESVEDLGELEDVYCVEVPDTETFALADNIWVHNCALRHHEMTKMWPGDKKNRQTFSTNSAGTVFSTAMVESTDKVMQASYLRAHAAAARDRIAGLTADGSSVSTQGGAFFIPIAIPEGIESGDGRTVDVNALSIRTLPISLLWQIKTADGHDGSVVVGMIEKLGRVPGGIGAGYGHFDTGPYGREAERMVRAGMLRYVSGDMDNFEATKEDEDAAADPNLIKADPKTITKARVMAVTIVAKPAYQEATIQIVPDMPLPEEDDMIPEGIYMDEPDPLEAAALIAAGYVASVIPITPPAEWFTNPRLTGPTPLTVTDDGKVFGHIAAWDQPHMSPHLSNVRPPHSKSGYRWFHTGVVRTEQGTDVPVGQLTLAGGHADITASAAAAVKHYDDTASAVADVHAGEDDYGIWVSGALRTTATPEQIRALRASAPSGDWRPIKNSLELVAVCQVNVPGFPIARAMVASGGHITALVAAGAATLAKMKSDPIQDLNIRMDMLEQFSNKELALQAAAIKARFDTSFAPREAQLAVQRDEVMKRMESFGFVSQKARKDAADKGEALPDGSFPIRNPEDLKNAIKAHGRAKPEDQPKIKKHIAKRARAMGKQHMIPENWKTAASEGITASVTSMREQIAERQALLAAAPASTLSKHEKDAQEVVQAADKQNVAAGQTSAPKAPGANAPVSAKYTPGHQPRDYNGQFRDVLARINSNLGDATNQKILEQIKATQSGINTGDYIAAAKAGLELRDNLDRLASGALDPSAKTSVRAVDSELGKVISNLPFDFGNQAEKVRFSDLPPTLRDLMKELVQRTITKLGPEKAQKDIEKSKAFMSGQQFFSQKDISTEMSRMLNALI